MHKNAFYKCFGNEIQDQDQMWIPHFICTACITMIKRYNDKNNIDVLKFNTPTVWSKPQSREDRYFYNTDVKGFNIKNKLSVVYANVSTMTKPTISIKTSTSYSENYSEKIDTNCEIDEAMEITEDDKQVAEEEDNTDLESDNSEREIEYSEDEYVPVAEKKNLKLFNQEDFNDLIQNLELSKDSSEYLVAELKKRRLVENGTKSSVYRYREKRFQKYFEKDEKNSLVYCSNIQGLKPKLKNELKPNTYKPEEWRLFVDSSNRSLKLYCYTTEIFMQVFQYPTQPR